MIGRNFIIVLKLNFPIPFYCHCEKYFYRKNKQKKISINLIVFKINNATLFSEIIPRLSPYKTFYRCILFKNILFIARINKECFIVLNVFKDKNATSFSEVISSLVSWILSKIE